MENTELYELAYKIGERALKETTRIFDDNLLPVVKSSGPKLVYEITDENGCAGEIGYCVEEMRSRMKMYDVDISIICKTPEAMKVAKKVEKSFEGVGKSFPKIKLNVNLVKCYADDKDVDAFFKKERTESL